MLCPECRQAEVLHEPGSGWKCQHCGASGQLEKDICQSCGMILPPDADRCPRCGAKLSYIDDVLARPGDNLASSWLQEARSKAGSIKERESIASEERMRTLQAVDEARQRAERESMLRAQQQERKFLTLALLFALIFFAAIILGVLVLI